MFVSCWSVKGGSGTTVVAVALATLLAERSPAGSLLVDLGGDAGVVLGVADLDRPGVTDWLAAGSSVPADGWARLELAGPAGVSLVPRGDGACASPGRAQVLAGVLASDRRPVVVDCGVLPAAKSSPHTDAASVLAAQATRSLLVTRACYLSLRRAARSPLHPSGIVLVSESGRRLRSEDVEAVLDAEVWAEIPIDDAVARVVDAGLLATRLPRVLRRSLREVA